MKINFAHVIFVGDDPEKVNWLPRALITDYQGGHPVSEQCGRSSSVTDTCKSNMQDWDKLNNCNSYIVCKYFRGLNNFNLLQTIGLISFSCSNSNLMEIPFLRFHFQSSTRLNILFISYQIFKYFQYLPIQLPNTDGRTVA